MSKLTSSGQDAQEASEGSAQAEQTRDALYQQAAVLGINGRSRMTKEALARAIATHEPDDAASSKPGKRTERGR